MPVVRLRRLRKNRSVRDWISETRLVPKDLVLPYFVVEGKGVDKGIKSLPGVRHLSIDKLLKDVSRAFELGIGSVLLFGISGSKDEEASWLYKEDGIVQKAVKEIRRHFKDLIIITDVCLCGGTPHGHCGILNGKDIDNDATLEVLSRIAVSHAGSGADLVAPSAMMDGQVRAIRKGLDANGFEDAGIWAYSAKYASNFYGPFRDAFDSAPQSGDRKTYQMDFRNADEALRKIGLDIEEGADMVMVKPALSYLDIIYRAKQKFNVPVAAYNVSGEYAMVKAYIERRDDPSTSLRAGRVQRIEEEKNIVMEMLTGIKRAGADFIITYWAKDAAGWLR